MKASKMIEYMGKVVLARDTLIRPVIAVSRLSLRCPISLLSGLDQTYHKLTHPRGTLSWTCSGQVEFQKCSPHRRVGLAMLVGNSERFEGR